MSKWKKNDSFAIKIKLNEVTYFQFKKKLMTSTNVLLGFATRNVKYTSPCIKKKKPRKEHTSFDT